MPMRLIQENKVLKIEADIYRLVFASDRPFVYLEDISGKRMAELFIFSGVHPLHGRDDTVRASDWVVKEAGSEIIFSQTVQSSVWRCKTYRFSCRNRSFDYQIEVEGEGQLSEVDYFGGYYSGQLRWGSGHFWSGQSWKRGFNPGPNTDEANYFGAGEGSLIELMGVPLPGKGDWFFTPPPFAFCFESSSGWTCLGVEAEPGTQRFTEYAYRGQRSCFSLSLSYEGHTFIRGRYCLPMIGFHFGSDEYEALENHIKALKYINRLPPSSESIPAWWSEPIFCGWGEQCYLANQVKGRAADFARQELYEGFLKTLEDHAISPGMVVLDDKWQGAYGDNRPDPIKWPDLKGFIERQHAAGRKVLLWIKAWDPEGLPNDECIVNSAGMRLSVDPTNPAYEDRLRQSIQGLLCENEYNADGLKIDFTARIPSGPSIYTYGDSWGLELMKRYLSIIYTAAKHAKSDALVMTHTPHPYLMDVLDMIRLNDMNLGKDINSAMWQRARVARLACPGALIDTDNWPITDRAAWRKYLALQPELGIPSLYYATHIDSSMEALSDEDYALVKDMWQQYRGKISGSKPGYRAQTEIAVAHIEKPFTAENSEV